MNNKYDVAFSCAEEDLAVAELLAASLKKRNISYYLYTEHRAAHWGENIFKISLEKYGAEARFVLLLISDHYVKKHWSDIERQIAQTAGRIGEAYLLPLRLDDTGVDGLSSNIVYERWDNDPDRIAAVIAAKLALKHGETAGSTHEKTATTTINGKNVVVTQGDITNQSNHFS